MIKLTRNRALGAAFLGALGLAAAGCGGDNSGRQAGTDKTTRAYKAEAESYLYQNGLSNVIFHPPLTDDPASGTNFYLNFTVKDALAGKKNASKHVIVHCGQASQDLKKLPIKCDSLSMEP
jgi:hypothetical protein